VPRQQHDRSVPAFECRDESLELDRRQRAHLLAGVRRDLAQRGRRVGGKLALLDGRLQDSRQVHEDLAHCRGRGAAVEQQALMLGQPSDVEGEQWLVQLEDEDRRRGRGRRRLGLHAETAADP